MWLVQLLEGNPFFVQFQLRQNTVPAREALERRSVERFPTLIFLQSEFGPSLDGVEEEAADCCIHCTRESQSVPLLHRLSVFRRQVQGHDCANARRTGDLQVPVALLHRLLDREQEGIDHVRTRC